VARSFTPKHTALLAEEQEEDGCISTAWPMFCVVRLQEVLVCAILEPQHMKEKATCSALPPLSEEAIFLLVLLLSPNKFA
jgi:hypothetical protein